MAKCKSDPEKQRIMDSTMFTDETLTFSLERLMDHKDEIVKAECGLDAAGVEDASILTRKILDVIREHPSRSTGTVLHGLDCTLGILGASALDSFQVALLSDMTSYASQALKMMAASATVGAALNILDEADPATKYRRENYLRRDDDGNPTVN